MLFEDFNFPKRIVNSYINKKVEEKLSAEKAKALLNNAEARTTVASAIYYDIERYQSWYQDYWNPNPIQDNPKYNGMKEFYQMDTDTKILANMNQRDDTLINRRVYINPAIENNELELTKAGFANACLDIIPDIYKVKKGVVSSKRYGYSFSEKQLGFQDVTFSINLKISEKKRDTLKKTIKNALVIKNVRSIVPTAFSFDGRRNVFYSSEFGVSPVPIRPDKLIKFIRSTYDEKFGSPWGWPLYTNIFPHWIMKKAILAWRLIFLEKFGIPPVAGIIPVGTDSNSNTYKEFIKALESIMHSARIAFPIGYDVKFLETQSKAGTMDMFQNAINYIDQSISELILGHKQATEATSVGSLASSTVKEAALRQAILETDAMELDTIMAEQVVKFLVDLNFPSNGLYPDHTTYVESDDNIKERRETFQFCLDAGMVLSDTQVRKELHVDYPLGIFDEIKPEDQQRVLRYIGKNTAAKTEAKGANGGMSDEEKKQLSEDIASSFNRFYL